MNDGLAEHVPLWMHAEFLSDAVVREDPKLYIIDRTGSTRPETIVIISAGKVINARYPSVISRHRDGFCAIMTNTTR